MLLLIAWKGIPHPQKGKGVNEKGILHEEDDPVQAVQLACVVVSNPSSKVCYMQQPFVDDARISGMSNEGAWANVTVSQCTGIKNPDEGGIKEGTCLGNKVFLLQQMLVNIVTNYRDPTKWRWELANNNKEALKKLQVLSPNGQIYKTTPAPQAGGAS